MSTTQGVHKYPEEAEQIRKTMLVQLTLSNNPINRLQAMIGASGFQYDSSREEANVSFQFKAGRKYNACTIVLNGDDTYTMTIGKYTMRGTEREESHEHVYWDQLKPLFEQTTGLYLSL